MATRFPIRQGSGSCPVTTSPPHLIFQVGEHAYLLARPFELPAWAPLRPKHVNFAPRVLDAAAKGDPTFTAKLSAAFPHEMVQLSGPRYRRNDAVALAVRSIERRHLHLYALGSILSEPIAPKPLPVSNPTARPMAPSDDVTRLSFPERMLIVVVGMRQVSTTRLAPEALEFIKSLATAAVAYRLAAALVAWVAAHVSVVLGIALDVAFISYGLYLVGPSIFADIEEFVDIVRAIRRARTVFDLQSLSPGLAGLLIKGGILLFFTRRPIKRGGSGAAEEEAAASAVRARPPAEKAPPIPGKAAPVDAAMTKPATIAADSVPLGYTRAYRAVSHAEFDDIVTTGRFNQGPNSLEGKWFADRYDDVLRHGDGLEGPGNYRVVEADLPDNAPSLYRVPNLDNRGPARFLHMDDLQGVTPRPYRPR